MNRYEKIVRKITTVENLKPVLTELQTAGKKIVFTNGCFDIIHRGHVEYLAKAASFGDFMVLGLNSDSSVRRLKGETRPVQDEYSRSVILSGLEFVDAVVLFEEDTPYSLIKSIEPDILCKGADYRAENIIGYDIVKARGGEILTVELTEGFSTSSIIKKINS
jgi:rfaE bifunctional protein nucleotidyltransferase chain/domain